MREAKNKYQHNDDGTTFIFIETKSKYFPGKHTIVIGTEDWDKVKVYRWCLICSPKNTTPYVIAYLAKGINRPKKTGIWLHHLILGKPKKGMVTDHINHNGLDNRKENLRFATRGQNGANRRSPKNSTSQHLGVYWHKKHQKWSAQVRHNGKRYHLGMFTCEHQAALAYNKKAIELHGEYASLNVINIPEDNKK